MCACGLGLSIHTPQLCKHAKRLRDPRLTRVEVLDFGRPYQHVVEVPYEKARAVALQQMRSLPLEQLEEFAAESVLNPRLRGLGLRVLVEASTRPHSQSRT